MENKMNLNGGNQMETLIKIVKCVGGYERHYRVEGSNVIKIVWVDRPLNHGGK